MSEASTEKPLVHRRRRLSLRKLHALAGVVPVGVFLVVHLCLQAKALEGQAAYDAAFAPLAAFAAFTQAPVARVLELGLVILPLAFHALYGVKLALEGKPEEGKYPASRRWMYTVQRATGIVAFLFVGFHLWEYWAQQWLGRTAPEQLYPSLAANLSSMVGPVPVVAFAYLSGIAASAVHLALGLWTFCVSWGLTVSRRAQVGAAWAFGLLGLLVFLLGASTTLYFATGANLWG
ncbi:succinate dehydrogenase [Chondromyces apiculatus]|uniref:Succinate dehydrogenase cytochrome b558 subunit n=1 Tax=Chondromyces apiculatus DSM 436 TaxID=1192034 RepID=A0A017T5L2_9BACT|nr:succinate dehydrogenase [Chondromyces apiculatus]EYF04070.1 Succinate dehydrogenase cytochrome b558 subunit [Chondromyces apiculatus DSM 436]